MFRKIIIRFIFFCVVCVAQAFPSIDEPSLGKNDITDKEIPEKISSEPEAIKICSARFPQIPHDIANDFENSTMVFEAGTRNVPGVRCFIGCMAKTLMPETVEESGKINVEKIPQLLRSKDQSVDDEMYFVIENLLKILFFSVDT